ncbi:MULTISPECIES: radical SAM family heme chaperone HemW [Gammaproteobacteria]|uniref:radical SAM family heme chaperone HemW n=1 Tax=Gammaproteobacteria TaxID=1236 RepID=UPI000DCFB4D3|nr:MULTISPECIES: radical SAM family heme chaperone HemW [Gammaproteobacteria]RTE87714.1 radical SAM family heme chaperone HemW [Aliidiomarina sp. B3213]TCZ92503.1 radical SAM family heme chaperone HemW [Lysobacter sp. N42]
MITTLPPLSLYIHIPWCVQKCPYCDFNSHAQPEVIPEANYINCLLDDLRADQHFAQGREIVSIFIGGGTPSLFSAEGIERLLQGVASIIPFAADIEITLEANPGTFEQKRFSGFNKAGVNRLSVGVQSLQQHHLQKLGRIHNPTQAIEAAKHAGQIGLKSFNLDLMHGLPNQTAEEALDDLTRIIELDPPHISWYQLTIEPNTLFASKPPTLPNDDALWDIYQQGHEKLTAAGYVQYEVSAYSKPHHQSRHNRNYWEFGDYIGIGCGAHGKITNLETQSILRTEKVKHPRGYMDLTRSFLYKSWEVEIQDLAFEYFMNRFRLMAEAPKQEFDNRTGLKTDVAQKLLENSIAQGLIVESAEGWQPSELGRLHLNKVLADLLPEN